MSESVQKWLLNQKWLTTLVNDKLAARKGLVGKIFSWLQIGPRQMGAHTIPKIMKFYNIYFMMSYHWISAFRPVFSRYIGSAHGPLNYTGIMLWFMLTGSIIARFKFNRSRDILQFNSEDGPEFWYKTLGMMFPPNFLNNKISAHYIEINNIYTFEMFKRYRVARREILEERAQLSDKEKRTRYITNPNYVYEPLGEDTNYVRTMHFK